MMRFVRRLLFFFLIFEAMGMLRLNVLLATIAVITAFVVCMHFILTGGVNSA